MVKILLEIDDNIIENEIIIKCNKIDEKILNIQKAINSIDAEKTTLSFFKEDKEYYLLAKEILFFETDGNIIYGHTDTETYRVKYRLNQLEGILPSNFMRISKSAIVNIDHIFSISYNIASSSLVQFYKSHKQIYASRIYAKELKNKLKERRSL